MGSAHPLNAPYQAFATADGWINVGAANQRNWLRLLEVLEAPDLAADPRFADNRGRRVHLDELAEALAPHFRRRTTANWLARLEAAGVPAGPVLSVGEMHADPHVRAREMVVAVRTAAWARSPPSACRSSSRLPRARGPRRPCCSASTAARSSAKRATRPRKSKPSSPRAW